jgi:pimeloyl-ACP methyl ester carboxylesterase
VVLVLYGGRVKGTAPSRPWHLSALRMRPFAADLHRAGRGAGITVATLRYRYRGWNGADASPLDDARWALDEVRRRFGHVPVVLVGHSMGGRAVLRVADDPSVRALVALAPWLPPGEPVADLRGRSLLILHGARDRTTDPAASLAYAEQAQSVTEVRRVLIRGSGHAMLRRAALWHGLTTYFCLGALADESDQSDQSVRGADPNHTYRIPAEGVHLQL